MPCGPSDLVTTYLSLQCSLVPHFPPPHACPPLCLMEQVMLVATHIQSQEACDVSASVVTRSFHLGSSPGLVPGLGFSFSPYSLRAFPRLGVFNHKWSRGGWGSARVCAAFC